MLWCADRSERLMMSDEVSGNGRLSPHDSLLVLNGIRTSELTQRETLELVTSIAKRTLLHPGEASISLVRGDEPWTTAFTGQLAIDLDERQYEQGYGPCLDCARSGQTLLLVDLATETRWPRYTPQALERGCRCSLSVPLPL